MKLTKYLLIVLAAAGLNLQRAQAQMPNTLKPEQKVYGLSKFWQEVNYNFVYLNKVNRKAWDSLYIATIPVVQQTNNDYEYYRELQKFCAFLNDGHTNISFPDQVSSHILNNQYGRYYFTIENINHKPIITHVNLNAKNEIPVGSEMISVNNIESARYINQYVKPYISSSTDYVKEDLAATQMLRGLIGQTYTVGIKTPKGQIKALKLTIEKHNEQDIYPAPKTPALFDLTWYPGQTAYIALNSFDNRKIDSLFIGHLPELYKAKAMVIDLRNNGGGLTSIGTAILKYLSNDSLFYGLRSETRIHVPTYKAWGAFVNATDTANNAWNKRNYLAFLDSQYQLLNEGSADRNGVTATKIIVPTVILIGHHTASAAEDFLIYADKQQHMVKVGQNTFGSTGQPYYFDLPGGCKARICTKKDTYPDGREFVGYGIKPDIEVVPTVKDFVQNNDPALNSALSFLKGKTLQNISEVKAN